MLTPQEIKYLLDALSPPYLLPAQLLYGSELRLMECVRLRVQDIDFNYSAITIWNAKGGKHRQVTLAPELFPGVQQQISVTKSYLMRILKNHYSVVFGYLMHYLVNTLAHPKNSVGNIYFARPI